MPQRIKVVLNNLDSFFITQPEVLIPIAFKKRLGIRKNLAAF